MPPAPPSPPPPLLADGGGLLQANSPVLLKGRACIKLRPEGVRHGTAARCLVSVRLYDFCVVVLPSIKPPKLKKWCFHF